MFKISLKIIVPKNIDDNSNAGIRKKQETFDFWAVGKNNRNRSSTLHFLCDTAYHISILDTK